MIQRQRVGMRPGRWLGAKLKTPLVTYDGDGEIVSRTGANVADRVCYRAGGGIAVTVSVGIGQQQPRVIVPRASGNANACSACAQAINSSCMAALRP